MNERFGRRLLRALAVGLALALASINTATADDAEGIFEQAFAYTVQVRTSVPLAFIQDDQGVSSGAGFVVDKARGWIMTNAHVTSYSPARVEVAFGLGRFRPAKRIWVDPFLDLAVLEVSNPIRDKIGEARLDCRALPGIGHPVGAFGHPWGLKFTGTRGIVSGRTSRVGGEMIQTDAPINNGNSGGPLISMVSGSIVGVNTASVNREGAQNTNFAVSMQHACQVLELLRDGKDPSPPAPLLTFFNLEPEEQLVVARSFLPPEAIPLRAGDRIIAVGDAPVSNEGQFVHQLRGRLDSVSLVIERDGRETTLHGSMPAAPEVLKRRGILVNGMLLAPLGYRDTALLGFAHDIGIQDLELGSDAEANELNYYDLVLAINGEPVEGMEQLYALLLAASRAEGESTVDVLRRSRVDMDVVFEPRRRRLEITAPEWISVAGESHSVSP
jgi:serine protease Do